MTQLVNSTCQICGQRISSSLDAVFCASCNSPIHVHCKAAPDGRPNRCAACGATRDGAATAREKRPRFDRNERPQPLTQVFSTSGRINRETYIWYSIVLFIVGPAIAFGAVLLDPFVPPLARLFAAPVAAFQFAIFWMGIVVCIKRLHDLDRPGSHWLLLLIPIYNLYLGIVLLVKPGTVGANRYGPDPLGAASTSAAETVLSEAYRHEMNGDWERAVELYKSAAAKLEGDTDGQYALQCIERIQKKMEVANTPAIAQPPLPEQA